MARTYVVSGSASGIGAKTTEMLREQGHTVIGIDLKNAEVEADLSTPEGRKTAAEKAIEASNGQIDAVIACAGISAPKPLTVAINYFGVVELIEHLRETLAKSDSPRVAVMSSMASMQPVSTSLVEAELAGDEQKALEIAGKLAEQGEQSGYLAYPSSKRGLSRWIRRECIKPEWAGEGIAMNAVAPGTVLTPMTKDLLATKESAAFVDSQVPMPLNYHQSPESVANLLLYLTSPENTHVTGQTIYNDGGADATLRGDDIWSWNEGDVE